MTFLGVHYSICITFILYFYLGGLHCANEIFNVDTNNVNWVSRPEGDQCDSSLSGLHTNATLFGFSITIDESKDSLFVGAPGCNGVYECPNFAGCRDVSQSKMSYSPKNEGKWNGYKEWFGASLVASDGRTVACAPRRISQDVTCAKETLAGRIKANKCDKCCNFDQYKGYHREASTSGSCYAHADDHNSNNLEFSLTNNIFPDGIVPSYTHRERFPPKDSKVYGCKAYTNDCWGQRVHTLENFGVLGNSLISGNRGSVIVGLPYAWLGETTTTFTRIDDEAERFVGTIGKIQFDFSNSLKPADQLNITVPKPQKTDDVIKKGGAVWGGVPSSPRKDHMNLGKSQFSSSINPVRNFYSGTSISRGRFFSTGSPSNGGLDNDKVDYAVGAPNGDSGQIYSGIVYLCPNCFRENDEIRENDESTLSIPSNYKLIIKGFQYGEKFGQTVLAIDIDGDNYEDLVIGAPLHSVNKDHPETGTIYVYRNRYGESRDTFELKAVSEHTNMDDLGNYRDSGLQILKRDSATSKSRFGSSLINLGRFDGDKYDDFAVGAPYEDGGVGAIYIYRGSKTFWEQDGIKDAEVKIKPKMLTNNAVKGFGYSFSNNAQKLENGRTTKFAVGAVSSVKNTNYQTDVVAILKSRPTIAIIPNSKTQESNIIAQTEALDIGFLANAMAITNLDPNVLGQLTLKVSLVQPIDSRLQIPNGKLIDQEWSFSVPRDAKDKNKYEKEIKITNPKISIKSERVAEVAELQFKFNWSAPVDAQTYLKDPRSSWEEEIKQNAWINPGCKDIKACKCKLVLEDAGQIPEIVLGQDKVLDVKFVLSNTGNEPAIGIVFEFSFKMNLEFVDAEKFDCKKEVMSQGGRNSLETDSDDSNDRTLYTCEVNKLDSGEKMTVDIPLKLPNIKIPGSDFRTNAKNERYQIKSTFISSDKPGCGPERKPLEFHFYTKYKIKGEAIGREPEKPMANSSLSHQYVFKNMGPSASSQPYPFIMVLPNNLQLTVDKNPASRISCNKSSSVSEPYEIMKSPECADLEPKIDPKISRVKDFVKYDCIVDQGWEKDDPYKITIKMEFNTNMAMKEGKLLDKFLYPTFIKTEHDGCFSHKTIFTTSDIGKSAVIQQIWPIILGVCISAVLFAVIMVVMYKKGWFSKLRFYKPDDSIGDVTELGQLEK